MLKHHVDKVIRVFLWTFISISFLRVGLCSSTAGAQVGSSDPHYMPDWSQDWLLLERATFETSKYLFRRDPYVPELSSRDWNGLAAMEADFRVLPGLRWNNRWHTSGDYTAVRHVGWEFELAIDYFWKVQPFYYHHSQHVMEYGRQSGTFPVEDRYGIRVNLYDRRKP